MIRVGVVSPEPTPYRAPLFDRVASFRDIDLTVIYAARTVAGREWNVRLGHPAIFLDGVTLPTARVLHHDYPVTPGVVGVLKRERFDCLVVAGWSLFAAQAAVAWARLHSVPYLVMSESHLLDPRPGWIRAVKRAVIPRVVRPAAGVLVTGTVARRAAVAFGADAERVRVFANTIDVASFARRVEELRLRRDELRAELGLAADDVVVLSVARLADVKGLDVLIRASAEQRGKLVLAGSGPEDASLRRLASDLGVPTFFTGFVGDVAELYAVSDVFALLSRSEPWGVVVVEAAAASLPLVLSDRVGAGYDLLRPGENGERVPVDDVAAARAALQRLLGDGDMRRRFGARSRELAASWGYESSADTFADAVRVAVGRPAVR